MTISTLNSENTYTANGSQTVFPFTFQILEDSNGNPQNTTVNVYVDSVLQSVGFSTVGNSDQEGSPGGNVTFSVAPTAAVIVNLKRATPQTQLLSFPLEAKISTTALETAFDKTALLVQENSRDLTLKPSFPAVVDGGIFGYDASGNPQTVNPVTAGYALIDNGIGQPPSYQPVTSATGGNVVGPGSSTSGNIPQFADTTGKTLSDSGSSISSINATLAAIKQGYAQLRVYLVSGDAEADGSSSGNSTVYVGPYKGGLITADNGSSSLTSYLLTEKSAALTLTATQAGSIYLVNTAGVFTVEVGQDWSGSTPPAYGSDALGRPTKSGSTNKLLVGTFYCSATNKIYNWTGERSLENEYNKIPVSLFAQDATTSWTTASTSLQSANSNTTNGVGRFSVFCRKAKGIFINCFCSSKSSTTSVNIIGIGLNSTTVAVATNAAQSGSGGLMNLSCSYSKALAVGINYAQRLEAVGGGTGTFYYDTSFNTQANGMSGYCSC